MKWSELIDRYVEVVVVKGEITQIVIPPDTGEEPAKPFVTA
jgi:hypothetical protein